MNCLVCDMEGSGGGQPCKLCGMRSKKPLRFDSFAFCCRSCITHYRRIMSLASASGAEKIRKEKVLI